MIGASFFKSYCDEDILQLIKVSGSVSLEEKNQYYFGQIEFLISKNENNCGLDVNNVRPHE